MSFAFQDKAIMRKRNDGFLKVIIFRDPMHSFSCFYLETTPFVR